jgi:hypothetical protein
LGPYKRRRCRRRAAGCIKRGRQIELLVELLQLLPGAYLLGYFGADGKKAHNATIGPALGLKHNVPVYLLLPAVAVDVSELLVGCVGSAGGVHALEQGHDFGRGSFRHHLEQGPVQHDFPRAAPNGQRGIVGQLHVVLGPVAHRYRGLFDEVAELGALLLGVGAGVSLTSLAFAQAPFGQVAGSDVLDGLIDELHLSGCVEHGRVAGLPVALHKPAGLRTVRHIVVLRVHFVRPARGQHLGQRSPHVGYGVGLGSLGVVGEGVEDTAR